MVKTGLSAIGQLWTLASRATLFGLETRMGNKKMVLPFAVWIGVGVALGVATGNLAVWIGLGAAFGLLSGFLISRKKPD